MKTYRRGLIRNATHGRPGRRTPPMTEAKARSLLADIQKFRQWATGVVPGNFTESFSLAPVPLTTRERNRLEVPASCQDCGHVHGSGEICGAEFPGTPGTCRCES